MVYVKSLRDAVTPLIWLNCIFCMGIFEIPVNRPRFTLSVFYTISTSIAYFYLLYRGIVILEQTYNDHFTLFYCVAFVNIIVASCSIILFWRNSQNIHKLLKRFSLVDDTLEALGVKKNYTKLFYIILSCMVFWVMGMILLNAMYIVWMWSDLEYLRNIYTAILFGLPIMINSAVDITFVSLIRCTKTKFQNTNLLINDVVLSANEMGILKVRSYLEKMPLGIVKANCRENKNVIKHLIHTLKHLHLELTRIGHEINGTFCLQLLLELAVHFAIVTGGCYYMYVEIIGNFGLKIEKIVAITTWGLVYSLKIISVNNLCTRVSNEACKTAEIVQSFDGSFLDDELRGDIRQFIEQIMLNPLNFTAAGFFKINNALTGAFFATVTTYLVLLIQMGTSIT